MTQQCRECGANLPDGARSCMQCGTSVELTAKAAGGSPASLDFLQPAIAGGLLLGLLSSLPIFSMANLFFGVWVLWGGALTAHLLMKQRKGGIGYGDGAFGGVLSGLFGSIVATIMMIPDKLIFVATWMDVRKEAERQFNSIPGSAGPMRDLTLRAFSPEVSLATEMFWFFLYGILFSLFAMFAGILMVGIARRRKGKIKSARP